MPERVEHVPQAQVQPGKRFGLVPEQFEQRGAVGGREASGGVDGLGPVQVLELLDPGVGPEVAGNVVLQIEHVVFVERSLPRRAFGPFRQFVHTGGDGLLVRRSEVATVGVIRVRQNLDEVEFGEQAQFDRESRRSVAGRQGEACDEAGGFLAARRIDVPDEVGGFLAERGEERAVGVLRQRRDEVGLPGLARAEHAHAHFPRGGGGLLTQGAGQPIALAQQRFAGGAHGLRVCPDPFVHAAERSDARFALFDKPLIFLHHGICLRRQGATAP